MRRLVKVFRVRYEHTGTRGKTWAEYAVIATSEIRARQEVLRVRCGFTDRDTVREFSERLGCTVTAEPWTGPVPTIASLIRAESPL